MIQEIKTTDLYCSCGRLVSRSLPNSEHFCRACDRWLVFKNGVLVSSSPMEEWKRSEGILNECKG